MKTLLLLLILLIPAVGLSQTTECGFVHLHEWDDFQTLEIVTASPTTTVVAVGCMVDFGSPHTGSVSEFTAAFKRSPDGATIQTTISCLLNPTDAEFDAAMQTVNVNLAAGEGIYLEKTTLAHTTPLGASVIACVDTQ